MKNILILATLIYAVAMTYLFIEIRDDYHDTMDYKTQQAIKTAKEKVEDFLE